jgi:hypothetical protein
MVPANDHPLFADPVNVKWIPTEMRNATTRLTTRFIVVAPSFRSGNQLAFFRYCIPPTARRVDPICVPTKDVLASMSLPSYFLAFAADRAFSARSAPAFKARKITSALQPYVLPS